jgi:phosphate:Na+ symporter
MELRLVRLCHAVDHLSSLERDLGRIPPAITGWQPPAGFDAGAHALETWLAAASDPQAPVDPVVSADIHDASKRLSEESRIEREQLLGDIALKRLPPATARGALDMLTWADGALYDAWRLAGSLQTTAAYDRRHVVGSPSPDRDIRDAQRPPSPDSASRAA